MFKVTGRPDISVTNKYNIHNWLDRIESVDWRTCSFVGFFLYQHLLYVSLLQNLGYSHKISYRQLSSSQEKIYALVWPETNLISNTKVEDEGNWGSSRFFVS